MMGHNQLILVQEHVANGYGLVQQPTGISPHVQDQPVQGRSFQFLKRLSNLAVRGLVESRKPDVSDSWLEHESDIHGVAWNLIARHREHKRLRITLARNSDFNH